MSYRRIFYRFVFGTNHRAAAITKAHCEDLYKYIRGVIKNKSGKLYRINGTKDQLDIFSDLHPSLSLADYVLAASIKQTITIKRQKK